MSRLRWTLVTLLLSSTALFAVGVIGERSSRETHTERAAAHAAETGGERGEPAGAHSEGGASEATASGEASHVESGTEHAEGERLFGVDVESTPLVVLAVLAGLSLAALAASRIGLARGFLLTVVVIALAWAALDIREVVHQLDESRIAVAVVAIAVAALHLAVAAISGRHADARDTVATASATRHARSHCMP
jgi:hypothetical protein